MYTTVITIRQTRIERVDFIGNWDRTFVYSDYKCKFKIKEEDYLFNYYPIFTFLSCNKENVVSEYVPIRIPCTLSKNLDTAKIYIQGDWS